MTAEKNDAPPTAAAYDDVRISQADDSWESLPCECGERCSGHGDRIRDDE